MAVSSNNLITKHFHGRVGDVVLRWVGGKSVLSIRPDCSKVIKTGKQLEIMNRFAKAVKYGQFAITNPQLSSYYKKKIKNQHLTVYNAAISDFLSRPVIEIVDASGYKGLPGNAITASVWDKWKVEGVNILVYNAEGEIIESGAALEHQYSAGTKWVWNSNVLNTNYIGGRIEVHVKNKPGNIVSKTIYLDGS